ncbi:hypothetical protein [Rubritalea tangerina]|uniref:hypothetical protein n=1 Tax=Rubritalea tangerina TaxID=430798 RepID=UPI00360F847A
MTCYRTSLVRSLRRLRSISKYDLPSSWKPSRASGRRTRRCTQPLTAVELRSTLPTLNP